MDNQLQNLQLISQKSQYRQQMTPVWMRIRHFKNTIRIWRIRRKKIPDNILVLIDPAFPSQGATVEGIKSAMMVSNQLIPADQAKNVFNFSNKPDPPIGDQIHLEIYLTPTASLNAVDSNVTAVTIRNKELHALVAWVDINNIEKLVAPQDVVKVVMVVPPEHSAYNVQPTVTEKAFVTPQTPASPATPAATATPSTPVSTPVIIGALVGATCVGLFFRRKRR
ncbi:MAG: hypothetical protein A4E35_02141 [Methanoregula sp. PtaU1.Bin051]|nr:MAG: hypothetical protein A4E35_02141 [Methanoregula sp. PtaU1.Bin051]